jgi:hypothetical protein
MLFILKIGIVLINFKLLLSAFLPNYIVAGIPVVAFSACLAVKSLRTPILQFICTGWFFFYMLIHVAISIFILNQDLLLNYIVAGSASYLYISLYAWLILLLTKNEIEIVVSFLMKLINISLIIFIVEKIMPHGAFHTLSNELQGSKNMIELLGESYQENILGMSFERYGTVYFEPLTAAIIVSSAYLLLSSIWRKKSRFIQIVLNVAVVVSFVKSAYLMVALSIISKYLKGYNYYYILIPIVAVFYFSLTRIDLAGFERIEGFESIGNHLIGLYYGLLAGYEKALFGNGVGTAGYNVYLEAIRRDEFGPFESLAEFDVMKNGNESGLGVILYQFGIVNTCFVLIPLLFISIRKAVGIKDYTVIGYILSLFVVSTLTESILSTVIFTMIFPMVVYRLKS